MERAAAEGKGFGPPSKPSAVGGGQAPRVSYYSTLSTLSITCIGIKILLNTIHILSCLGGGINVFGRLKLNLLQHS